MLVKQKKSLHPEYKQFLKNVKPRTKNYHDKSISITPLSKTTTSLFNKSIIKGKNCQSCLDSIAQVECENCSQKNYCVACYEKIHSCSKFTNHSKRQLKEVEGIEEKNETKIQQQNMKELQNILNQNGEIQKWDEFIKRLRENFQSVINNLISKKEEILDKLKLQKQKQLNVLKNSFQSKTQNNNSDLNKSLSLSNLQINLYGEFPEKPKAKESYSFRYKLNDDMMQDLQKIVEKVDWKSIIYQQQIDLKKHKKTSSMNFSNFHIGLKKNINKCNISKSIIDLKNHDRGRNDKTLFQDFYKQKNRKIMAKARSERTIKNFVKDINMNIVIE